MQNRKTILFCPLNWGLGHAARIVPLVNRSLNDGNKVILAANGNAYLFLKQEFPTLEIIYLKGFSVRYWPRSFYLFGLFLQLPIFYFDIFFDQIRTRRIVKKYKVDKIISDNRYGCHTRNTYNILITHQLFVKVPKGLKWAERFVQHISLALVRKFNECWIPDYQEVKNSLSGELSHGASLPLNVKYIGPLSRFSEIKDESALVSLKYPDVLILISGPEPSRSAFEKEMDKRFYRTDKLVLMVCGKPGNTSQSNSLNVIKVPHLNTNELCQYLKCVPQIISRSGYTTIMDLHILNRSAELIPTPMQPEQEYLAVFQRMKPQNKDV